MYDESDASSTRASCAVFVTPTTINNFLLLKGDNHESVTGIKRYNKDDLLQACSQYTTDVFRIIEPIIPSASKITKLFRTDDFKLMSVGINPLYSKSINHVEVSASLASASVIRIGG